MFKHQYIFALAFLLIATYAWGSDEDIYIAKGALAEKDGKYEYALEQFKKATIINPYKSDVYLTIGRIYREKLNRTEAAVANYEKGLEYDPDNFEINRALMYAFFDANRIDQGLKIYEKLSSINIERKKFSLTRKVVDELSKEMPRPALIELSKKYVDMNPTDTVLRELIADDLGHKGNYQEAKKHYELLLKYSSNKGPIYFALAVCAYNLQSYDEAMVYFKKAEDAGKDVPKAYYEMIEGKRQ